jgi:hypothetical protein
MEREEAIRVLAELLADLEQQSMNAERMAGLPEAMMSGVNDPLYEVMDRLYRRMAALRIALVALQAPMGK